MRQSIKPLVLGFLLCSSIPEAMTQTSTSFSIPGTFARDVSHVVRGTGYVLASPFRWGGKDWAIFGGVLAGTFALSFLDEPVNDFFLRNHSEAADKLADVGVEYGEPRTAVLIAGGTYLIGLFGKNDFLRESAVILSASLLPAGGIQTVTKIASGRARPHLGLGHAEFDPFRQEEAYYSFFSGHTMVAMATSHVFAKRIDNVPVKVLLYGLGSLAGLSRMYNEDHWLSDVTFGSVLAIASVNSVSSWLERQKNPEARNGLQWQITPHRYGAQVNLAW